MFFIDKLGNIEMARGDCADWYLPIYYGKRDNKIQYELEDNDVILFAVFDTGNLYNENIIEKTFSKADTDEYGRVHLSIGEADTMDLPVHNYYYIVKLFKTDEQGNMKPYTITNKKQFNIIV